MESKYSARPIVELDTRARPRDGGWPLPDLRRMEQQSGTFPLGCVFRWAMTGQSKNARDALRRALYEAHGNLCWLCKRTLSFEVLYPDPLHITIDHVVPLSLDGTWDAWNLRLAHYECNNARGNSVSPEEISERIARVLRGEWPPPRKAKVKEAPAVVSKMRVAESKPKIRIVDKTWTFFVNGERVTGVIFDD